MYTSVIIARKSLLSLQTHVSVGALLIIKHLSYLILSYLIYHNFGLVVSHAARSLGVSLSQYIDDRHVGQLFASPMRFVILASAQRDEAAAYIVCYILIEAGYFINTDKSQYVPSTVVCFLGFLCDSLRQAFLIPQDKKTKFATLRESILSSSCVSLKTLQRFAGKVVSFSLAIPGCKLYVREVFNVIAPAYAFFQGCC